MADPSPWLTLSVQSTGVLLTLCAVIVALTLGVKAVGRERADRERAQMAQARLVFVVLESDVPPWRARVANESEHAITSVSVGVERRPAPIKLDGGLAADGDDSTQAEPEWRWAAPGKQINFVSAGASAYFDAHPAETLNRDAEGNDVWPKIHTGHLRATLLWTDADGNDWERHDNDPPVRRANR